MTWVFLLAFLLVGITVGVLWPDDSEAPRFRDLF